LSIAETLNLSAAGRSELATTLLEEFGIEHLRRQGAYTLSGGEYQRIMLTRLLGSGLTDTLSCSTSRP
jgi:ABC-type lipopolysaccharide export system ATPase subunit